MLVLLGKSWGKTWELGEPCGNTLGTRKKKTKFSLAQKEKFGPVMKAC